jgi:endonuclease VIII
LTGDPDRRIGEALLDQRNLAGIGNLYQSEGCFLAGVDPRSPVASVPALEQLIERIRLLLNTNKDRSRQSTTGDLRRGQNTWVYLRAGRPCRRCGSAVKVARQGQAPDDRVIYWCPSCQPC